MMPLPTQETFKLLTCLQRSARTHTHRKIPTICLLAARQYRRWDAPSCFLDLTYEVGEHSSLWLKPKFEFTRFWKSSLPSSSSNESKSEKLSLGFKLPWRPACGETSALVALSFSAWRIRESHLAAGPLSSAPSTFPALRGTISWNLLPKKKNHQEIYDFPNY